MLVEHKRSGLIIRYPTSRGMHVWTYFWTGYGGQVWLVIDWRVLSPIGWIIDCIEVLSANLQWVDEDLPDLVFTIGGVRLELALVFVSFEGLFLIRLLHLGLQWGLNASWWNLQLRRHAHCTLTYTRPNKLWKLVLVVKIGKECCILLSVSGLLKLLRYGLHGQYLLKVWDELFLVEFIEQESFETRLL